MEPTITILFKNIIRLIDTISINIEQQNKYLLELHPIEVSLRKFIHKLWNPNPTEEEICNQEIKEYDRHVKLTFPETPPDDFNELLEIDLNWNDNTIQIPFNQPVPRFYWNGMYLREYAIMLLKQ